MQHSFLRKIFPDLLSRKIVSFKRERKLCDFFFVEVNANLSSPLDLTK